MSALDLEGIGGKRKMTLLSKKWLHFLLVAAKYLVFLMILILPIGAPVLAQSQAMPDAKVNPAIGEAATKAAIPSDISKKHVLLLHAYSYEAASLCGDGPDPAEGVYGRRR